MLGRVSNLFFLRINRNMNHGLEARFGDFEAIGRLIISNDVHLDVNLDISFDLNTERQWLGYIQHIFHEWKTMLKYNYAPFTKDGKKLFGGLPPYRLCEDISLNYDVDENNIASQFHFHATLSQNAFAENYRFDEDFELADFKAALHYLYAVNMRILNGGKELDECCKIIGEKKVEENGKIHKYFHVEFNEESLPYLDWFLSYLWPDLKIEDGKRMLIREDIFEEMHKYWNEYC